MTTMTPLPYMLGPNFQQLNRLVARNDFELQAQIRNTLRLLEPQAVIGYEKARFGDTNDGGYVHLDDFEGVDTAVSLGIDHNISWDLEIADRGLKIYQFDHTVEAPAPDDARMVFSKTMIAPQPAPGAETLESIVRRLDRGEERPNLILKMDIERCEWDVLEATSLDAISRFSQITCELHYFEAIGQLEWRQKFFRGLRKLAKFYAPIHIHANNFAAMPLIAGVAVPCVLEVTFANRALYRFEECREVFPGPLDAPCNPNVPDHFLGAFRFHASSNEDHFDTAMPVKTVENIDASQLSDTPHDNLPDEWRARANAATARRERLMTFGTHASGILVSTDNGPMVVDAEDNSVGAALLTQGSYADHEYMLARSLIPAGGSALIVGAHIGAHVVRLARHCRELIAIEANPKTFRFLEANVRLNRLDNVTLLNFAAGEADRKIEFLLNRENSGGSKRQPIHSRVYYNYDYPEVVEIDCKKLDDLLPPGASFDLIFMDIEGSEYFALQGMQAILSRSAALSIEFLTHHIHDVAAAGIQEFSALITPHFKWMFLPDQREFVAHADMADRMRSMYETGQSYDCLYFLKTLDAAWLKEHQLPDPHAEA